MPAPAPGSYDILPTNIDGSPIPDVIIITGERPSTFDHVYMYVADGFDAFMANGYISVGATYGFGISATWDFANNDLYLGINAGTPGASVAFGVAPPGEKIGDFLPGFSATGISPIGVGTTGNNLGPGIAIGSPGFAVGYNVNASNIAAAAADAIADAVAVAEANAVIIVGQANSYFYKSIGISDDPY